MIFHALRDGKGQPAFSESKFPDDLHVGSGLSDLIQSYDSDVSRTVGYDARNVVITEIEKFERKTGSFADEFPFSVIDLNSRIFQ